jgi:glycosyltransferase involved in cell wall biosynthesis
MKKILVIHNKYRNLGGEDIAVENEILLLKEKYEVEILYFDNNIDGLFNSIAQLFYFLINKNLKSRKILEKVLDDFSPDLVYVHNTWFKASLVIFDVLKKREINTFIKIHNFRYSCTQSFLKKTHLKNQQSCPACGLMNSKFPINNYFQESIGKSILAVWYGKGYLKRLLDKNFNLIVLTDFHKKYIEKNFIYESEIIVLNNYLNVNVSNQRLVDSNYIIYAGRISKEKGVENLINSFLHSNLGEITLKIIGLGPDYNLLADKYSIYENIEFLGQIDNKSVLNLIQNSKAVVTATKLLEGQPTILCEASKLGIPSIFPDTGGVSEFFPESTKLSFKQFDYDDLKIKLNLLKDNDLLKKEGLENEKFISILLDKKTVLKKFESLFSE